MPLACWKLAALLWLFSASAAAAAPASSTAAPVGAQGARWQTRDVELAVDPSMADLPGDAYEILVGAVGAWQLTEADLPTLAVTRGDGRELGYDREGNNVNSVRFERAGSERAKGALAITIITFDAEAGEILDADIVINGEHEFAALDSDVANERAYDIQNVLTHELGHLLGLGEDLEHETATMYAYSLPGEVSKRDLDQSDAQSVSHLYAAGSYREDYEVGCGAMIADDGKPENGWLCLCLLGTLATILARRRARLRAYVLVSVASALAPAVMVPEGRHWATVGALQAHWEGGLIVTTATLIPDPSTNRPPTQIRILGGSVGRIEQRVGALRPPQLGERLLLPQR